MVGIFNIHVRHNFCHFDVRIKIKYQQTFYNVVEGFIFSNAKYLLRFKHFMALRGRKIENFDDISLAARSWGLPICVNIHQQKGYHILVKNWTFDDPFHKKGPLLVILVPGMIQPSGSVIFLMKWGCRGHWGHWGCWGCWDHCT